MKTIKRGGRRLLRRTQLSNADPQKLATAAMERIRTCASRQGHAARFGTAATMMELSGRAAYLGLPLPQSYATAMRVSAAIGESEDLLDSVSMRRVFDEVLSGPNADPDFERLAPFCRLGDGSYACFDRASASDSGELEVVRFFEGRVAPLAPNFGAWLDQIADRREDDLDRANTMPLSLQALLEELGFRLLDAATLSVDTSDVDAIEALIGPSRTAAIRSESGRLFGPTGKAEVLLSLDDFRMTVTLRRGTHVIDPEEVFTWLRYFRDANFYGDGTVRIGTEERVRDLRTAPPEAPAIRRGRFEHDPRPAMHHFCVGAAGASEDDFYLLLRPTSNNRTSLIAHVQGGAVKESFSIAEPLAYFDRASDGFWAISAHGSALAIDILGGVRRFALPHGGIGRIVCHGREVYAYGEGGLLVLRGDHFEPFFPDPELDPSETVTRVIAGEESLSMLVVGPAGGAVAHFESGAWRPIHEDDVIEGSLVDYDLFRNTGIVMTKSGEMIRIDAGPPRPVLWDMDHDAFRDEQGRTREITALRAIPQGTLLGAVGGTIAVHGDEPLFFPATEPTAITHLTRLGEMTSGAEKLAGKRAIRDDGSIVATSGPDAWLWRKSSFCIIDLRDF